MMFRETVAVYCENHTEHINTLCWHFSSYLTGNSLRIRCLGKQSLFIVRTIVNTWIHCERKMHRVLVLKNMVHILTVVPWKITSELQWGLQQSNWNSLENEIKCDFLVKRTAFANRAVGWCMTRPTNRFNRKLAFMSESGYSPYIGSPVGAVLYSCGLFPLFDESVDRQLDSWLLPQCSHRWHRLRTANKWDV
jgi:hypothetical protein